MRLLFLSGHVISLRVDNALLITRDKGEVSESD
jgi:hypothetical protein